MYANPMLLKELLRFIEDSRCYSQGYLYFISFLLFVVAVIQSLAAQHYANNAGRLSLHRRTACMGLIFRKSLRIASVHQQQNSQKSKATKDRVKTKKQAKQRGAGIGKVATLISKDCEKIRGMSQVSLNIMWLPLSIITCMLLLFSILGVASLVGLGFSLILLPIQASIGKSLARARKRGRESSEQRVGLMHELVVGIRIIKLLAWEMPLVKKVGDVFFVYIRIHYSTLPLPYVVWPLDYFCY